jgi:hypothetical protein
MAARIPANQGSFSVLWKLNLLNFPNLSPRGRGLGVAWSGV